MIGSARSTVPVRILGIDPGSRITGWGLIESSGPRTRWLAHGCVRCREDQPLAQRLRFILDSLNALLAEHAPHEAAIEQVFMRNNVASALVLGQARGAALCALAGAGLSVAEYAPAQVKSSIVGSGRAEKAQIQHMVAVLLQPEQAPSADAADALAIALCHAHWRNAPTPVPDVARSRRRGMRFPASFLEGRNRE